MLDLDCTSALEGCLILVSAQPQRIPETDRILHSELLCGVERSIASGLTSEEVSGNLGLITSTQRRGGVQAPVTPCGAGQAILEEHPDDRLRRWANRANSLCLQNTSRGTPQTTRELHEVKSQNDQPTLYFMHLILYFTARRRTRSKLVKLPSWPTCRWPTRPRACSCGPPGPPPFPRSWGSPRRSCPALQSQWSPSC